MWKFIYQFFDAPFFTIIGGISTLIMIWGFIWGIWVFMCGLVPVWLRLGFALSKRKIAVFAESEFNSLKSLIDNSKIFSEVIQIHKNDLKKAEKETIFLVHWKDYKDKIDDILQIKKDSTALIVYRPSNEKIIDKESSTKINNHRNSIIVNFRGRLLNDIFVSLITTAYERI